MGVLLKTVAAKRPKINAEEQEERLRNAKSSRSPTLANSNINANANLAANPPAYISILQHGNMSLEEAEELKKKDGGEGSSAPHHTSSESQTKRSQSEAEIADYGALDDPSSLVYRLTHR